MVQVEYYCETCKDNHYGNCPKIEVVYTFTSVE